MNNHFPSCLIRLFDWIPFSHESNPIDRFLRPSPLLHIALTIILHTGVQKLWAEVASFRQKAGFGPKGAKSQVPSSANGRNNQTLFLFFGVFFISFFFPFPPHTPTHHAPPTL